MRLSSSKASRMIFLIAAVLSCALIGSARSFAQSAGNSPIPETTAPDFTITISPASPTISDNEADATITLTGLAGFSGNISLACSVLPNVAEQPECFLFNNPVTVDSSQPASIVTMGARTQPADCEPSPIMTKVVKFPNSTGPSAKIGITLLIALTMVYATKLAPACKLSRILLMAFICTITLVISGCGSSATNNFTCDGNFDVGTPAGTYILTVVATSGSLTHMATVTLVVPPLQ
jgi:hypothetical protein